MEIIQNKTKKIIAVMILLVTLISMACPVFAASKNEGLPKVALGAPNLSGIGNFFKMIMDAIAGVLKAIFSSKSSNIIKNNSMTARFTYYTKEECNLGENQSFGYGLKVSDFEIDPTLGCYTYKGDVVLAAATTNLLNNSSKYKKLDYVHYFKYPDKVSFTFNGKKYTGIIIDSCGVSMNPTKYYGDTTNVIDMMFPTNSAAKKSGINQQKLTVYY